MSISMGWLLAGAVLLALEAFGVPGIGLLFAGMGAIVTGIAVETGLVDGADQLAQGAVFLLATSLSAMLLWRKLKTWRMNRKKESYHNMIGNEAIVAQAPLKPGAPGTVQWSGTLLQATLEGDTELAIGRRVVITAIDGNVVTVKAR